MIMAEKLTRLTTK